MRVCFQHAGNIQDERNAAINGSLVYGTYEEALDRESAYEKLASMPSAKSGTQQASPATPAGEAQPAPQSDGGGLLGGLGGALGGILFGSTGPRGGKHDGLAQMAAKSATRTIGSAIGREIVRGVLGSILGGRR